MMIVAPYVGAETGGGSVTNVAPTTQTFANLGATRNVNTADVFSGTVRDTNLELDLVTIQVATVTGTTGTTFTSTYNIAAGDLSAGSAGSFVSATTGVGTWRVWNADANNAVLNFEFQYTYTATGTYNVRLSVKDEGSLVNTAANTPDISVNVIAPFTILGIANGAGTIVSENWGNWAALPAATNVQTENYLALENTGEVATQAVTINFQDTVFTGVTQSAYTIAVDNNIQFACQSVAAGTQPSTLTWSYGTASATGSANPSFGALDQIMYCKYQLVSIPATLYDQAYTAIFTAV